MLGALLYLRLTSLKNILLSRLRRLKQPKYLLGAIVGAAYFYFVFFRRLGSASPPRSHAVHLPAGIPGAELPHFDFIPLLATGGSLLLLLIATFAWALPANKPGLAFTEAEVAFLFPAPISRRRLIHFKLLGSQFRILVSALFFTLITSGWSFLGGDALTHALGWWIILTAVNLHLMGATLTITRLIDRGVNTTRRRVAVLGIVGIAAVVTAVTAFRSTAPYSAGDDPTAFFSYVARLLDAGALHWLLLPGKWTLAPFLAGNGADFLRALPLALGLVAAHYLWVLRMEVSFEEASVAAAEKRGARLAQIRSGNFRLGADQPKARREPFRLRSTGRPELAFLWKNLLSTRPYFHWRVWLICAAVLGLGVPWIVRHDESDALALMIGLCAGIFAVYTLLLGPQLARQDLRSDLPHSDILKTYPLAGWQVILGQLLTPLAILTGLLWLMLLALTLALWHSNATGLLTPGFRITTALCIALLAPALCAVQLMIPNAAALMFPAWFQSTRQRGGGIDVMGQRLIFVVGQLLVILLALLPAILGAGVLIFASQWLIGPTAAVVFATVFIFIVLVGEIWCGLWWLGGRFEKLDLATELRP